MFGVSINRFIANFELYFIAVH